jgi:hypothetical protein
MKRVVCLWLEGSPKSCVFRRIRYGAGGLRSFDQAAGLALMGIHNLDALDTPSWPTWCPWRPSGMSGWRQRVLGTIASTDISRFAFRCSWASGGRAILDGADWPEHSGYYLFLPAKPGCLCLQSSWPSLRRRDGRFPIIKRGYSA